MTHTTREEIEERKGCTIYLVETVKVIGRIDRMIASYYEVDDNEQAFADVDAARDWIDDHVTVINPRTGV